MTYTTTAENKQTQFYYDNVAFQYYRNKSLQDGDLIIIKRFCNTNLNYVYHRSAVRFIGEY